MNLSRLHRRSPRQSRKRRTGRRAIAAALAMIIGAAGAMIAVVPAMADPGLPTISAAPTRIYVGATSTITVSGLADAPNARLAIGASSGATFKESGKNQYTAPVSGGVARATFTASEGGIFTVYLSDGETTIAQTNVTVVWPPSPPAKKVTLNVQPANAVAGENTIITATGLTGVGQVTFASTGGGAFVGGGASATVPVANGSAQAIFTADHAGTFTVAVSNGSTVLASTVVQVSAASPAPTTTPTPSPTPSVAPVPSAQTVPAAALWITAIVAVLLIAGIVTAWAVVSRRRRSAAGGV